MSGTSGEVCFGVFTGSIRATAIKKAAIVLTVFSLSTYKFYFSSENMSIYGKIRIWLM